MMPNETWITFEGYEGRLDPGYSGRYASPGIRYPYVERNRTWDIVRVNGEPRNGLIQAQQFVVLSRGHDMMRKAHEEAAAYRLHFKRCAGVGVCQDMGHPGGPKRSQSQKLSTAVPDSAPASRPVDVAEPPANLRPEGVPMPSPASTDWIGALNPSKPPTMREVRPGLQLTVVPLEFELWPGPPLGMAEDCNKHGGRLVGDAGELSCAEVEIVKLLRAGGWDAAWCQSFACGRRRWRAYIADSVARPAEVRKLQATAGSGGGHPDVLAWRDGRIVALESKGQGDALRQSQLDWFERALRSGVASGDVGLVEWRMKHAVLA
jgi:hypothetical protein